MFTKNLTKGILALSSSVLLSFALTACGGGSGDTTVTTTVDETEKVVITAENSESVISTVSNVISGGYSYELPIGGYVAAISQETKTTLPSLKLLELPVFEKVLNTKQTSAISIASTSYTYQCADSGYISYTAITDYSVAMNFNNCVESGILMNGTVKLTTNSTNTSVSFAFTNFLMTDGSTNSLYYQSLTYALTLDPVTYELTSMSISITGSLDNNGETAEFVNYRLSARLDADYNLYYNVSGYVTDPCTNAWIGMETLQEIKVDNGDTCPTQGQIRIDGNDSDIIVTFNSDASVDVTGAIEAHYNSCTEISNSCAL